MIKILLLVSLILLIALIISIKINIEQSKDKKQLKNSLKIMENIYEKTEKINSGNINDDFNESINILSDYANKK